MNHHAGFTKLPYRHVNSCSAHRYAQDEPLECGHFVHAQRGDYKLADSVFSIIECSLQNLDSVLPQRIIQVAACGFAQVCLAAFLSLCRNWLTHVGQVDCTHTHTLTCSDLIFISHRRSHILSLFLSYRLQGRCDLGITGSQTLQTFAAKC